MTGAPAAGELRAIFELGGKRAEDRLRSLRDAAIGPVRDELSTQVARALGLQGRYAEAYAELDAIMSAAPVVLQRIALERGRLLNSSGRAEEAIAHFVEARRIDADLYLSVDALHMLAIADPANSEDWTRRGLHRALTSSDTEVEAWQGSLLNNHGWNLADAGREVEALHFLRRAETWFSEHGTVRQRVLARWSVAHLQRRTGDNEGARRTLEALLGEYPAEQLALDEFRLLT